MVATLLKRGLSVDIFALIQKEKCEVFDFFEKNKNNKNCNTAGFLKIIDTIADEGYIYPREVFKSWKEQGELFCEIIKGDYRIGCFKYEINGKRLLLVTTFIKKKQKQKDQYNRTINIKKKFDKNSIWEDENGNPI